MKKIFSLIKAVLTEDMNLFKISTKKKNNFTKIVLPIFLAIVLMGTMYGYSEAIMEELEKVNMEFVLLALFVLFVSILTIIEGIYKSGNLLFNCKDDNLLLSLPIKKTTVLFIRVFKFYVFELLYNTLFILPAMIVYGVHIKPSSIYYIVSFIGLLLFPIIPILISSIIGVFITFVSSQFKGKKFIQTMLTFMLLLGILYFSYNFEGLVINIAQKASSINNIITKIYYPAGIYIELIKNFNIFKLIEFVFINLGLFIATVLLIGKIYFNINSKTKAINMKKSNRKYIIKTSKPIQSLIKKEFSRFISSTVFVTNAGFGLVLYIVGCVFLTIKFDSILETFVNNVPNFSVEFIRDCTPLLFFAFVFMASFMTSITSSMISLEGKSINILKSLPIKPHTIIKSKVLTALLIMLPFILIGDIVVFIKFKFNVISMIFILIASVLFPLVSETIGIIVNLKYPRMDAKNDTEVVKQSMSSAMSVFIGMGLIGITMAILYLALQAEISQNLIMFVLIILYSILYTALEVFLHKTCEKSFNNILV